MKKDDKKTKGRLMSVVGFLMILFNAISYITSDKTLPTLGIIGLVFVVVGINWTRSK